MADDEPDLSVVDESNGKIRVLFVCLGNICRSPMAEAVFRKLVEESGLSDQIKVDSAGTGHYHLGEPAHRGTRRVLAEHGIHYQGKARQVQFSDLEGFDYLVAMDQDNLFHLQRDGGQVLAGKLYRLLDFASHNSVHDVPDPYYTGDFRGTYRLVEEGCRGLLAHIREQHDL